MYLIANFKENKAFDEVVSWVKAIDWSRISESGSLNVVIAPSYLYLDYLNNYFSKNYKDIFNKNLFLSSQDVSEFAKGSHTGEVAAYQLKNFVKYSIVGHSERRNYEDYDNINSKLKNLLTNGITPILCFSNLDELKNVMADSSLGMDNSEIDKKILCAYEPIEAIGSGSPASPKDIQMMFDKTGLESFIYGGSVNEDSIVKYTGLNFVNGFLVGTASLNPESFESLIKSLI